MRTSKRRVLEHIGHFLYGIFTSLISHFSPALAIVLFLAFALYELDEDWHIKDGAYIDIRNFVLGLILGGAITLIFY